MRIGIASDHAGVDLKRTIIERLNDRGHQVTDYGPVDANPVDYPDKAEELCRHLLAGDHDQGILICGTGIGMSMAANKIAGIRAALCRDEFSARAARQHNDANVLVLGSRVTGTELAWAIMEHFIAAQFDGGRHARRVAKLCDLEARR